MEAILPPYGHLDKEAVQCVAQASFRYQVPELLLHAILFKENGRRGQCTLNKNKTRDCGIAQINSTWEPYFKKYGVTLEHLTWDNCTNVSAAAYILKKNYYQLSKDWTNAAIAYNIGPNNWTPARYAIGAAYATSVLTRWNQLDAWVRASKK